MKLTWKERIFSLKEVNSTHRQLCVLGVRIKLRRNMQLHPRLTTPSRAKRSCHPFTTHTAAVAHSRKASSVPHMTRRTPLGKSSQ